MIKRVLHVKSGFTLMEILIALILLSGAGVLSLSAFTSTAQLTNTEQNTALNLGRSVLERLHEYVRQDQWNAANLPLSLSTPGPQNLSSNINGQNFTASYQINNTPSNQTANIIDINGDGVEDYRRVTVTVTW